MATNVSSKDEIDDVSISGNYIILFCTYFDIMFDLHFLVSASHGNNTAGPLVGIVYGQKP